MPQKTFKILVVDDDKAFLSMIGSLLRSTYRHVSVETVRSGKECIEKMKKFSPNLVLLDIGMDRMNGLVTVRFIKSIDESTRVFFLSGHSQDDIKEAVAMVRVDGYFTKTQFLDSLNNNVTIDELLSEGSSKN